MAAIARKSFILILTIFAYTQFSQAMTLYDHLAVEKMSITYGSNTTTSLYFEQKTAKHHGIVILLHDLGLHADWPDVIRPISNSLPEHGWSVSSVHLAEERLVKLSADEKEKQTQQIAELLRATINALGNKNPGKIVVAAQGQVAYLVAEYLSKQSAPSIAGLISINSQPLIDKDNPQNLNQLFSALKLPTLDIFGNERNEHLENARDMAKSKNAKHYRMIQIIGANDLFSNHHDELIKRIRGWLKKKIIDGSQRSS